MKRAAGALILLCLAGPCLAGNSDEAVRAALLQQAEKLRAEEQTANQKTDELAAYDRHLATLAAKETAQRTELARLLAALERLSSLPPSAIIARPEGGDAVVNGGLLMRAAIPAISARVEALRQELKEVARLRALRDKASADLIRRRAELAAAEASTRALVAKRQSAHTPNPKLQQSLADAARDARTLDALSVSLARVPLPPRRPPPPITEIVMAPPQPAVPQPAIKPQQAAVTVEPLPSNPADSHGDPIIWNTPPLDPRRSVPPVIAPIAVAFGRLDPDGAVSQGLWYRPRPGATVVAPRAGTVAFAAAFGNYGETVILEHDGGYKSVLAQLGRIDVSGGQELAAGEPIGRAAGGDVPWLYFEYRKHDRPVDPAPLFAVKRR